MQVLVQLCEAVKHHQDKRTDGIRSIVQSWKEKNELCKRLLVLLSFYNSAEVRNRTLELLRMIVSTSPNETLQYLVHLLYTAYFSSAGSQLLASYCSANCASTPSSVSVPTTSANSSSPASGLNLKNQLTPCPSSSQLTPQAVQLMGPYFPVTKKLNLNQILAYLNNAQSKQQPSTAAKPSFNMFLPLMFISHSHLNGSVMLYSPQPPHTSTNDYEKTLIDNYLPYLTFFDFLCVTAVNRGLLVTSTTPPPAADSSTSTSSFTGQLVDLIMFISQQSILLNITFVSCLYNHLSVQSNSPANTRLFELMCESPYVYSFVASVLNDHRHLINRKEIVDFLQVFLARYLLNQAPTRSGAETLLLVVKPIVERCCHSVNEIRFYFEFQQLSKHLANLLKTAQTDPPPSIPNITQNLEFKSSQFLGSIKVLQLLLERINTLDVNENNFLKFKLEIRNFLIEIIEYLKVQYFEMNSFLIDNNNTPTSHVEPTTSRDEEDDPGVKKPKLNDDPTAVKHSSPSFDSLFKQVELKRKHLDHILQILIQTIHFISQLTLLPQQHQPSSSDSEIPSSQN